MCSSLQCPRSDLAIVSSSGPDPGVSELRQLAWVPFTSHDGYDDLHTGLPGDVADNVLELDVHLRQRLVHVLDMMSCILHKHRPLTQVTPQAPYLRVGSERP